MNASSSQEAPNRRGAPVDEDKSNSHSHGADSMSASAFDEGMDPGETSESHRLLREILHSSSEGILAVNRGNQVLFANERFMELWRIPPEVEATRDDNRLLEFVLDQLADPEGFLRKVRELYDSTKESFDILHFKDGRVFERLSRPLMREGGVEGRVWSFRDVSDQIQTVRALRESEERYRSLFDRMMDGVYRSTHNGKFVDVNPAMVKMFGYDSREEMLEIDIKKELYFAPEERGSHILDTGREEMDVYRMKRKDGSEIWVEDHGYYVHDKNGNIIYHEGMLRDITNRKQIEDALAASEAELRALFASMHDVILVIDREGVYRKIGPTNPGLLVRPPEELLGKNLRDIFPKEDADTFLRAIRRVLDSRTKTQIEYKLLIDGQMVWFQTTVSPLGADQTLWVAHDITNRKQSEEALRTAEANFRSIFENATVGIYQSTMEGNFLRVNPVMAQMFSYESPEAMVEDAVNIGNQFYADPARRQESIRIMMDKGELSGFVSQNICKDGRKIWTEENSRLVKDADENILYMEGFLTDITGRKKAEEDFRRYMDELAALSLELQDSVEREKILAATDGLTSLTNRRHFFNLAEREFRAAIRHGHPLTFLMFDMDGFKNVNDTLGHIAGDKLLIQVARIAVAQVRGSDLVARYGGDEFVVMLPHATARQALPVAERIRSGVAAVPIEVAQDADISITLSVGIAELCCDPMDESLERVIQRADEALYKAKFGGRNRTVTFGSGEGFSQPGGTSAPE